MWMHLIAAGQEKYFFKSHNKRFREKKKKRFRVRIFQGSVNTVQEVDQEIFYFLSPNR